MSVTDINVYKIALTLVPGLKCSDAKNLVRAVGSVQQLFANIHFLERTEGISKSIMSALASQEIIDMAEKQYDFVKQNNIRIAFFTDDAYPKKLKDISDAPVLLYSRNGLNFDDYYVLAIVGTRKADDLAKSYIYRFVSDLHNYKRNILIISGMAVGVDTFAHEAALEYGFKTAAVLGHGLDKIYPSQNSDLADKILSSGGDLLTEFYWNYAMSPSNFPQRNRIVSGLCDGLLVAQTPVTGGAIYTAKLANAYNKDVFAFSGRPDDILFDGCNRLIRNNVAAIVNSAEDLEHYLGWVRE